MTGLHASNRPVGDVLAPIKGGFDLRSFDPAYLEGFLPRAVLEAEFDPACWFQYGDVMGDRALRDHLSARIGLAPDHILITDGASQALYLSILVGLKPGDAILAPQPVFPAYTRMADYRGCTQRFYPCTPGAGALADRLNAHGAGGVDGVIINSPHNPTGVTWARADIDQALDAAARRGVFTILDDTYHWIEAQDDQLTKLSAIARTDAAAEHTVAVASLGKFLCVPGLRLGFAASRNLDLINRMTEAKRHLSHASCRASERLALALLCDDAWTAGRRALVADLNRRRSLLEACLQRHGAQPVSPAKGFYVYASRIDGLKKRQIVGIEGPVFDASADEARYCLAAAPQTWRRVIEIV